MLSINGGNIEWSSQVKYLGFIFARRGGFARHIAYLRKKAFARLNLLKALATKSFGARSHHLVTLVGATISSLVDYGASSLAHCCISLFNNIEVIQTSALRVALGLPKWTPNIVLRHHAGFSSFCDKSALLRACCWIKHWALAEWSPLRPFLDPSSPHIMKLFDELNCSPDQLITFDFPLTNYKKQIIIYIDDFQFQNCSLASEVVAPLFQDFMASLDSDYICIGTDASKSVDITSIAGYGDTGQFGYRIANINSIFTAEALALCTALDELMLDSRDVILFSDSKSTLQALANITRKSPKIITRLYNKIARAADRGTLIKLCWVPGHRSIWWNEKADRIAKSVDTNDALLDWISPEDCISYIRKNANQVQLKLYRESKYFSSHGVMPSVQTTRLWSKNRRLDVLISRLVCRMLITPAALFKLGLVDTDVCSICGTSDTIDHILFSCRRYHTLRETYWRVPGGTTVNFDSFANFLCSLCMDSDFRSLTINSLISMDRF